MRNKRETGFPDPSESPFEHPNGNIYEWNGWAWDIVSPEPGEKVDPDDYITVVQSVADDEAAVKESIESSGEYTDSEIDKLAEVISDNEDN